jgi:hypothetical protein
LKAENLSFQLFVSQEEVKSSGWVTPFKPLDRLDGIAIYSVQGEALNALT